MSPRHNVLGTLILTLILAPPLVSAGWIDIETPLDKRTTTSFVDGTTYHLIMSDEFNVPNRSFKDGHDPIWTALDKSDDDASSAGGGSMQFYNSSAVSTEDGFLKIETFLEKTEWNRYDHVEKEWKHEITNFTSGMVQSWNKFCFTGGIVEVDIIFPGDPSVGGLWPAIWMLGNLGRATYEASTNNLWPWSYDVCNRELQQAQTISACNSQNHYGMKPFAGRGATEIDIVEAMMGDSNGYLPHTDPPIALPYADLTLQVAPGVPKNRPQSGTLPLRKNVVSKTGHTEFEAQIWYKGLEMHGNTSINPFFYGTYLAETRPFEPVSRSKEQAFQADAIGAAHQLTDVHFEKPHTFRLEWQPGRGGRLDWYVKAYRLNDSDWIDGDGNGDSWAHVFSLKDACLEDLMGSHIPIEPSYLIMNTAVSSTWGFPYDAPEWCPKCYDCNDPRCACSFYPGFCRMLESRKTAMKIDSIRVYQSRDDSAHVGAPHTSGCDPLDYPTKEWIHGHEYRYMRNPPFSYEDLHPLRSVQRGGGSCRTDNDCGANIHIKNLTAAYEKITHGETGHGENTERRSEEVGEDIQSSSSSRSLGRGRCTEGMDKGMFSSLSQGQVCTCNIGFTGPYCLSLDHFEESPSASAFSLRESPFHRISSFAVPIFMLYTIAVMSGVLLIFLVVRVFDEKKARRPKERVLLEKQEDYRTSTRTDISMITGTSI